ncbi:MAG: class I SAM-dependent methyltransferase [Candidatus Thiodiazotropha sp. (ex Lucinoma borealis)]|nr:class I SAM-dependent methyltransferase [Candidatus Thiodiazotropha sp. (ex Lucinoma borealis)]
MSAKNAISSNIIEIRPKVVFQAVEKKYPDQNTEFIVNIPTSAIGGLTLLESSLLVSFIKLISPQQIFEFGTYMGATTLLFARNSQQTTSIFTVDIDPNAISTQEGIGEKEYLSDDTANDEYLKDTFSKHGAIYINRTQDAVKQRITQIYQDSTTIEPQIQNFLNRFELIFIDGGHDFNTVKCDTDNALRMATDDSIIIWHDFRSQIHGDVTRFINEFCNNHEIIHIQNTMLALMLMGKYKEILK